MKEIISKKFLLITAIAVAAFLLYEIEATISQMPQQYDIATHKQSKIKIDGDQAPGLIRTKKACENSNNADPIFVQPIGTEDEFQKEIEELKNSSHWRPADIIAAAGSGEGRSAVALFEIATTCRSLDATTEKGWVRAETEICRRLSPSEIENPLELLRAAIRQNSAQAKLAYAQNSLARINFLQSRKSGNSLAEAEVLLQQAEKYGKEAAQAGLEGAYLFMLRAYYTGQFGKRNSTLAYAYLLPLMQLKSSRAHNALAEELQFDLSQIELERSWQTAFGCKQQPSTLTMPF
jgi:TPR repeat protein